MKQFWLTAALLVGCLPLSAQLYPEGSQVISYFPHLAVGGPSAATWTTSLTFVNPHQSAGANAVAYFYDDNGSPLALDFGTGPAATLSFAVPAQGSVTLNTTSSSSATLGGWAVVASGLPLQGILQYGLSAGGVPQQSISVQATPASRLFRSPATRNAGIAVGNPYTTPITVSISVLDAGGNNAGQTSMVVPALGHRAFNLFQSVAGLPAGFQGSVVLTAAGASFPALTISANGVALSSYPPAGLNWPASQTELIYKVWSEVLCNANQIVTLNPLPKLVIDTNTTALNSYANPTANEVHIFLNLAELISDSESELAFVIGHELGHIIQSKVGLQLVPSNKEQDADQYGMFLGLISGYDPYGAAGALAKLAMASGNAGLVDQNFDNLAAIAGADLHGSFNNRLALVFQNIQAICALSTQLQSFCASYKSLVHPHLPAIAPLSAGPPRAQLPAS